MWVGDIASAVAALIAAIDLALATAARNDRPLNATGEHDDDLRAALYRLRRYLADWGEEALRTNSTARRYAEVLDGELPLDVWVARDGLDDAAFSQMGAALHLAKVDRVIDGTGGETLLELLGIHREDLRHLDLVLYQRLTLLRGLRTELDTAYAAGGRAGVEQALEPLHTSAAAIDDAAERVASFIRDRFPAGGVPRED